MFSKWFVCGVVCCVGFGGFAASPYGVCAHLNRMPESEMKCELAGIAEAGIRLVRVDLDWKQINPAPGEWNFARWDALVKEAEASGVEPLAIIGGELPKVPYRNQKEFLEYVSTCVRRYKGRVKYYEFINEADCERPWGEKPSAAHYAELLKTTYRTIKAIDPGATVLFSGVSFVRNPFPFLEEAFAAGAGDACDALNFHPYQWRQVPEAQLRNKIVELRALMKKYGISKPVWVTEIGNSSGRQEIEFAQDAIDAAFSVLGIDPATAELGIIHDDDTFYYADGIHMQPSEMIPRATRFRNLTFPELYRLDPAKCPAVILPGVGGFPSRQVGFVKEYLKRGGTVVVPGDIPFYFALEKQPNGMFTNAWLTKQLPAEMHFDWFASWTKKGVPSNARKMEPSPDFPNLRVRHLFWTSRFLSDANCTGGDRMIPLYYGVEGAFRAPVAALYRFDSELKGNLILLPAFTNECSSEAMQAALLARQYLLLRAEGVDGICYYRYRAGEWNPGREAHFGIMRKDYSEKPAGKAYKTLIRLCPENAAVRVTTVAPGIYTAAWTMPSGENVTALWSAAGERKVRLDGEVLRATGMEGSVLSPAGEWTATPEPVYLESARGVDLKVMAR